MQSITRTDPRIYQIASLLAILSYGIAAVGLDFNAPRILATIASCLATQWLASRAIADIRFDPLSAFITSLSLTLLLRTDALWIACLAGFIAIASKFLIRVRGRHLFNPANFALILLMAVSDRVWVSSGQWGSVALVAISLIAIGLLVLNRVGSMATSLAFISTLALLLIARAFYLGDPLSIAMHNLQNGALLIFTFFMISDPRTTPNRACARVIFGAAVALLTFYIQFGLYKNAAPIWALAACMPLVPLLDYLLPAAKFQWSHRRQATTTFTNNNGVNHAL